MTAPTGKTSGQKARHGLRDTAARGLRLLGMTSPRRRHRGQLVIFTFHRVLTAAQRAAYPLPGLAVTPGELEWFLAYFARHYDCRRLTEAYDRFAAGEPGRQGLPLAAVTFDDGQRDNFEHAVPALNRAGIPGNFYLPTDHIDSGAAIWHDRFGFAIRQLAEAPAIRQQLRSDCQAAGQNELAAAMDAGTDRVTQALKDLPPEERSRFVARVEDALGGSCVPAWSAMMSWDEARSTLAQGHEIGSHSLSHAILTQLDQNTLASELEDSKARLETELDTCIDSICYPDGACDAKVATAAAAAGYRIGVTTRPGSNAPNQEALQLRRFDIDAHNCRDQRGKLSPSLLAFRISGLFPGQ